MDLYFSYQEVYFVLVSLETGLGLFSPVGHWQMRYKARLEKCSQVESFALTFYLWELCNHYPVKEPGVA